MHEMGIANSVLDAVQTEMGRHPGTYPCKVGVRIGEMAAIDQDALRFCFEAMIQETDLAVAGTGDRGLSPPPSLSSLRA
jgi:Zn finger protein HypA/HybF involved in hydrogenase expression